MSELHLGRLGAKRQTGALAPARAMLKKIMEDNPAATEGEIFNLCFDLFKEHDEYEEKSVASCYRAVFEHWFGNNYPVVLKQIQQDSPAGQKAQAAAAVAAAQKRAEAAAVAAQAWQRGASLAAQAIEKKANEKARIVLLSMIMPNGKQLRDCTREDCFRSGDWLWALCFRLAPGQKVGAVWSEKELQEIYQQRQQQPSMTVE